MDIKTKIHLKIRNFLTVVTFNFFSVDLPRGKTKDYVEITGNDASMLIYERLMDDKPLMVARFGNTELELMAKFRYSKSFCAPLKFWLGRIGVFWYTKKDTTHAKIQSGIFPESTKMLKDFSKFMIEEIRSIDILASWVKQEVIFTEELLGAKRIHLWDLEPFRHKTPWSMALKGKKVLVVHPFDTTIRNQYERREFLFENKDVLPSFELITLKSVQSLIDENVPFNDWFEALEHMKKQIDNIDFDIALIGCGAYGLPLAAHVKRIGKKAIHIGGSTQS
jgi:hypothetical protein